MKLISEHIEDVEYITEEKDNGEKTYKIKGVFMQSEVKNRNGRVYPFPVLEKEVTRYNKDYVNENRAFGELGHPDGPTVNLERASHMITSLEPDGKNFVGQATILKTPMGKEQKNGANYVKNDFYLATAADIVADPSAPNAFVQGIMEGKEWVWDNGALVEEELIRMKKRINENVRKKHANQDALEFAKFLKLL